MRPGHRDVTSPQPAFSSRGFLVAIVEDAEQAAMARLALLRAGFADGNLRISSGRRVLEDHERSLAQRSLVRRTIGVLTDDRDNGALYADCERDGHAVVWVRAEDKPAASRAIRGLADQRVLHFRYHGRRLIDIHVR